MSGIRRVGKTTFLLQDLVSALEAQGVLVIYTDLWDDRLKSPTTLVLEAVRDTLTHLQTPGSGLWGRIKGLNLGAMGISLGFQINSIGASNGATLAQVFQVLVAKAQFDVVLIIDQMHSQQVFHIDLNARNILMIDAGEVRLVDFEEWGCALETVSKHTT